MSSRTLKKTTHSSFKSRKAESPLQGKVVSETPGPSRLQDKGELEKVSAELAKVRDRAQEVET